MKKMELVSTARGLVRAEPGIGANFESEFFGQETIFHNELFADFIQLGIRQAKKIVRSNNNWQPCSPPTPLARRLFTAIQKRLPEKIAKHLRMYPTVGTPLDMMGIDCILTLPFHRPVCIDLKVIKNPTSHFAMGFVKKHAVDVVVRKSDFDDPSGLALDDVAQKIAYHFGRLKSRRTHPIQRRISPLTKARKALGLD